MVFLSCAHSIGKSGTNGGRRAQNKDGDGAANISCQLIYATLSH